MNKTPKKLKKTIAEHTARAWETEMRTALGELALQFDRWRAGQLGTDELDRSVHQYHQGAARAIWNRYNGDDPELALARAVALGILDRESLPPEVLGHLAGLIGL